LELNKRQPVTVVKVGGNVIDDENALETVLNHFAQIPGFKILVHGGGAVANEIASQLEVPQTMIEGRRVTDSETLKIATMVYGGLINKTLVAQLQARDVAALGLTGADGDLIRSKKRETKTIDYGFVGDIETIRADRLAQWMKEGLTPVLAPITHDGNGQLLNTNADTIANAVAIALSQYRDRHGTPNPMPSSALDLTTSKFNKDLPLAYEVTLIYSFEKKGVLLDVNDEASLISEINPAYFSQLKAEGKIFDGMIPKLENAFESIESGVSRVILGQAEELPKLLLGQSGTRITSGVHS
jgi:acetylglutamate kinase